MTPRSPTLSVSLAFGAVVTLGAVAAPAEAAVFWKKGAWPRGDGGRAVIEVCIDPTSVVSQRKNGRLVHDRNPSLDEVTARVKAALAGSWERAAGVRFVGWRPCTTSEQPTTVRLKFDPNEGARANLGYERVTVSSSDVDVFLRPWGTNSKDACLGYEERTAKVMYRWSCVEQYAIHEFGHILGFKHEWVHPQRPAKCAEQQTVKDQGESEPIPADSHGSTWMPNQDHFVPFPSASGYDPDSIMVYGNEKACADVTGRRFGSENLSPKDQAAARAVYPEPVPCLYAYGDRDYKGTQFPLGCGQDPPHKKWNDKIRSFKVLAGTSVTLCQDTRGGRCGGRTETFTGPADINAWTKWGISWYSLTQVPQRFTTPVVEHCPSVNGSWIATISLDGGKTTTVRLDGNLCEFEIFEGTTVVGRGNADASGAFLAVPSDRGPAECVGRFDPGARTFTTQCVGPDGATFDLSLRDQAAAPQQGAAWTCLSGVSSPVRSEGGVAQCASRNGRDCLWGTCPALPTGALQPLSCGADHQAKHGSNGFSTPGHWCAAICGALGCDHGWTCVPGVSTPVRNLGGHVQCASRNGRDCLWGTCPALPTGALQPLSCGADHQAKYGSDGYGTPGHWCAAACGPLGCTRP